MVYETLSSSISSFWPVITTVCSTFQLSGVKVSVLLLTSVILPSVSSLDEISTETLAKGLVFNLMVNCAVPKSSVVTRPERGVITKPASSLSLLVMETLLGSISLY